MGNVPHKVVPIVPKGLNPGMVGQVVQIRIWDYIDTDSEEVGLDPISLVVRVGLLEGYAWDKDTVEITLKGADRMVCERKSVHVEFDVVHAPVVSPSWL